MAQEAINSGAIKFIAKPFKLSQIRNLITELAKEINTVT